MSAGSLTSEVAHGARRARGALRAAAGALRRAARGLALASLVLVVASACQQPVKGPPAAQAGAESAEAAPRDPLAPRPGQVDAADAPSADGPPPLIVASDIDNPPFAQIGEDGQPTGREPAMLALLAQALGRPLEFRRVPFDTILSSVRAGFVHVGCATMGVTPERAELVAFSQPYFETTLEVVVREGEGEPRGRDDLAGLRVAAGAGTTSERAARAKLPDAVLVLENKGALGAAERLLTGEVDGIVMDGPNAVALVHESRGTLTTLELPLASERYAMCVRKDDAALLAQLDEALDELRRSGELQRLDVQYGLAPTSR